MSSIAIFASYAATFIIGAFTGATGKYLADKFTDQRRRQEDKAAETALFEQTRNSMPELISEMQADLVEHPAAREFFVLENSRVVLNSSGFVLVYYEAEHPELRHKIMILENNGYISDVTTGNAPKYRMLERFVFLLTH